MMSNKPTRKNRCCEGGAGGVMREPWKSRTILLASREGCERTERERAWEDLVTGRAGPTPPDPPSQVLKSRFFRRPEGAETGKPRATPWGSDPNENPPSPERAKQNP